MFRRVIICLIAVLPAAEQSQASEAITIKAARPASPRGADVRLLPNGDLIASVASVAMLPSRAYAVPVNASPRLSSLPEWTVSEKYEIEITAPGGAIPPTPGDREVRSRIRQKIRQVLADRFKLVMRVENKPMPFMLSA